MVCFTPMKAYRSIDVNPKTGKRSMVGSGVKALIEGQLFTLPCGGCRGCRRDRANAWAIRSVHESKMHAVYRGGRGSCFITLTIDPEHMLPHCSVMKRSLQKFWKRLRKSLGVSIRYLDCAEYGDMRGRPHYHAVVFGTMFLEDRRPWSKNEQGHQLFVSETLAKAWPFGRALIGDVSYQSARYVASYISKKWKGEGAEAHYTRLSPVDGEYYQVEPEFASMSLKPGLGETWFREFESDVFPSDECVMDDGAKRKPPRYYEKLFVAKHGEAAFEPVKRARKRKAVLASAENSPERRAVREELAAITERRLARRID